MIATKPSHRAWISLLAGLCLMAGVAHAQEPKKDEVEALIDQLTKVDRQDVGYSASVTGAAFLPLGQSETHTILLFQEPHTSTGALKSLVRLGIRALPALLKHLSDSRPTKITLTHRGGLGGMFILQDEKAEKKVERLDLGRRETKYTVMVGDLCYVAVGQIVNRPYWAVRYQPTAMILVTSVPRSQGLREEVLKEWGNLTAEKHQESLARDILESGDEHLRNGSSLRFAYYYPAGLEAIALKQLARPTYDVSQVHNLVRKQLYPARAAKDRKAFVDAFVARHGKYSLEGIRWQLFEDLHLQEADEKGHLSSKLDPPYRARECLIDLFGLPAKVKSTDRPPVEPLSDTAQARFIETLHYDSSKKLDQALRDIMAKTDDDYMAKGCLDRLVGRGYDADIEAYLKRRLPLVQERDRGFLLAYESKLGWTRLHAAVELGVIELIERELKERSPVDAQGRDGRTALHIAAAAGNAEAVEAILRAKANPNIRDKKGRLPAELAAYEDHSPVVRLLVATGSDVSDVLVAATAGVTDRLAALLKEMPGRVKATNGEGLQPLHIAAREGHADAVRALIAAGADVKALDAPPESRSFQPRPNGWTPLHCAVLAEKSMTATVLIDHGADVNAAEQRGKHTPLHLAAWGGNADLVKLLLARKADRAAKDVQDSTPLDLAKERGHTAVIKLLEK